MVDTVIEDACNDETVSVLTVVVAMWNHVCNEIAGIKYTYTHTQEYK